jgi:DNA polymerase III delta subunit
VQLFAGPGEKITRSHVETATSQMAEESIWDLTDAIGEGRPADALALLARMRGAPEPVVLGALAAHFRKLTKLQHGASVPGPPFVRKKLQGQARRFSAARLDACLVAIHETDLAIKGGSALPPELSIERLVLALAS